MTHTLPAPNANVNPEVFNWANSNVFISEYSKSKWPTGSSAKVIEHGIDVGFWGEEVGAAKKPHCLSVVNEFPTRDWCCGFNLWRAISENVPLSESVRLTPTFQGLLNLKSI